ncbi:MAG: bifunctional adenosylcobinamide kinase/adenosylcobinamide-phosphate guanylyltransferase [Antricoccus sp.]
MPIYRPPNRHDRPRSVLVTGGVRSGKSRYAESLLAEAETVRYIAAGYVPDATDPDWADRVRKHQASRPPHWETVESADLGAALSAAPGAVIVDCLGVWLTRLIDDFGTWNIPYAQWQDSFESRLSSVIDAWESIESVKIAVTNEVGFGVVPEHPSGRLFRDLLGITNQRFAASCDDVVLVIAGRSITL